MLDKPINHTHTKTMRFLTHLMRLPVKLGLQAYLAVPSWAQRGLLSVLFTLLALPALAQSNFPDLGPFQRQHGFVLNGLGQAWLIFKQLAENQSALYYLALTAALIGFILIVVMPKNQKMSVVIPWVLLLLIMLFAPFKSSLLFHRLVLDQDENGNDRLVGAFAPQLLTIHGFSVLHRAIHEALFECPNGVDSCSARNFIDDLMSAGELGAHKQVAITDGAIPHEMAMMQKECGLTKDDLEKSQNPAVSVPHRLDDQKLAAFAGDPMRFGAVDNDTQTSSGVMGLLHDYYSNFSNKDKLKSAIAAKRYPPVAGLYRNEADLLADYPSLSQPAKDILVEDYRKGMRALYLALVDFNDQDSRIYENPIPNELTKGIRSSISSSEDKDIFDSIAAVHDSNGKIDLSGFRALSQQDNTVLSVIRNQFFSAATGKIINKSSSTVAKDIENMPVRLGLIRDESILFGLSSQASVVEKGSASCLAVHESTRNYALKNILENMGYSASDAESLIEGQGMTEDAIASISVDEGSSDEEAQRLLRENYASRLAAGLSPQDAHAAIMAVLLDAALIKNRDVRGLLTNVSGVNNQFQGNLDQEPGVFFIPGDIFGEASKFFASVGIRVDSFFSGAKAVVYLKFLKVITNLAIMAVLAITPFIFFMGLLIPSYAMGVLTLSVLSIAVLKIIPITYTFVDAVLSAMERMLADQASVMGDDEQYLLVIMAASLYSAIVAITLFLMFKIGDPSAIAQLGAIDKGANQIADQGNTLAKGASLAVGLAGGAAVGASMGMKAATAKGMDAATSKITDLGGSVVRDADGKIDLSASGLTAGQQEEVGEAFKSAAGFDMDATAGDKRGYIAGAAFRQSKQAVGGMITAMTPGGRGLGEITNAVYEGEDEVVKRAGSDADYKTKHGGRSYFQDHKKNLLFLGMAPTTAFGEREDKANLQAASQRHGAILSAAEGYDNTTPGAAIGNAKAAGRDAAATAQIQHQARTDTWGVDGPTTQQLMNAKYVSAQGQEDAMQELSVKNMEVKRADIKTQAENQANEMVRSYDYVGRRDEAFREGIVERQKGDWLKENDTPYQMLSRERSRLNSNENKEDLYNRFRETERARILKEQPNISEDNLNSELDKKQAELSQKVDGHVRAQNIMLSNDMDARKEFHAATLDAKFSVDKISPEQMLEYQRGDVQLQAYNEGAAMAYRNETEAKYQKGMDPNSRTRVVFEDVKDDAGNVIGREAKTVWGGAHISHHIANADQDSAPGVSDMMRNASATIKVNDLISQGDFSWDDYNVKQADDKFIALRKTERQGRLHQVRQQDALEMTDLDVQEAFRKSNGKLTQLKVRAEVIPELGMSGLDAAEMADMRELSKSNVEKKLSKAFGHSGYLPADYSGINEFGQNFKHDNPVGHFVGDLIKYYHKGQGMDITEASYKAEQTMTRIMAEAQSKGKKAFNKHIVKDNQSGKTFFINEFDDTLASSKDIKKAMVFDKQTKEDRLAAEEGRASRKISYKEKEDNFAVAGHEWLRGNGVRHQKDGPPPDERTAPGKSQDRALTLARKGDGRQVDDDLSSADERYNQTAGGLFMPRTSRGS